MSATRRAQFRADARTSPFGIATMRVVTRRVEAGLAERLRELGCGVTEFGAQGREGPVEVVFTVVPRREIPRVLAAAEAWDPEAFITIEEPREIRRGWMYSTPRQRSPARLRIGEQARQLGRSELP